MRSVQPGGTELWTDGQTDSTDGRDRRTDDGRTDCRMDGRTDRRTEGRRRTDGTDGQTDGRADGRTEGQSDGRDGQATDTSGGDTKIKSHTGWLLVHRSITRQQSQMGQTKSVETKPNEPAAGQNYRPTRKATGR